jgi:hypothetical protein
VGIAAGIGRRCAAIFLGLGLGAKALAKSIDQKADDKKEAEPADYSRRKHGRLSLGFLVEHDLFRPSFARLSGLREGGKPGSTFRDHALAERAGAAVRAQFDGAVGNREP